MPASAVVRVECRSFESRMLHPDAHTPNVREGARRGGAVRYCVLLPPSYDRQPARRYPVLYFFHGLGDNEQSLVNFGGWNLLERLLEEKRVGEYLVVAPDGGRSFYINARGAGPRYEDFFLREFIPAMERRFRIQAGRRARGIAGVSMGGYGALHYAFKYPERFVSVSAHSAALIETLPRGIGGERSPAGLPFTPADVLGDVFGSPLDTAYYAAQSPLTLARAGSLRGLKIYFDCGDRDEYGFDRGAVALDALLKARRVPHEFHLYPGGHSGLFFAQHLAATFEFHSRAFGLTR